MKLHLQVYYESHALPTITSQKISAMICYGKIIFEKGETTISPSRPPLFHFFTDSLQGAKEWNKHIPI